MPDIVHVTYAQTGRSSKTNCLGMREIDQLVDKLYDLTPAEIAILEVKT